MQLTSVLALFSEVASADPITFRLSQGGWTGGGQISGTFTGNDLDRDGTLALDQPGEILEYEVHLSGNELIPAFTHALNDLKFFRYRLGSAGFPPSFPLFSDDGGLFYDADDKVIGGSGFRPPFITTTEAAAVVPVPELSTVILLSSGLGALLLCRRRRSARPPGALTL
jgi:hypothetical protein